MNLSRFYGDKFIITDDELADLSSQAELIQKTVLSNPIGIHFVEYKGERIKIVVREEGVGFVPASCLPTGTIEIYMNNFTKWNDRDQFSIIRHELTHKLMRSKGISKVFKTYRGNPASLLIAAIEPTEVLAVACNPVRSQLECLYNFLLGYVINKERYTEDLVFAVSRCFDELPKFEVFNELETLQFYVQAAFDTYVDLLREFDNPHQSKLR